MRIGRPQDHEQPHPTEGGGEQLPAPDFADPAETQHEFAEIEGGASDASVRNEKQIVADSHAEFPDESIGQRFGGTDGSRAMHDGGGSPQSRPSRWRRAAVAMAGVGIGAWLLGRRRRRRRAVAAH